MKQNLKSKKNNINFANWNTLNFQEKFLDKMQKYSEKGFWIQGSSILWLIFLDFQRLPQDIDLALPNYNFKNFDEKFLFFQKAANFYPKEKYDYFNWIEDGVSIDIFLNYAPTRNSQKQKIFKINQKEYQINFLSLESAYFSKVASILWKSNDLQIESEIELLIKKTTIRDIEFLFGKIDINKIDFEQLVKDEIAHSFCTNFENLYKDIEKLNIAKISTLFVNKLVINNIKDIIKLFAQYRDYLPNINTKLIFDWKRADAQKKKKKNIQ